MSNINAGQRGTKEIYTRYPKTKGIEEGEDHSGRQIQLKPTTIRTQGIERPGLNE